ncbi:unannotated protein [freshwater metagenome]|uniref:Unannotated protein n=1 Tax=freshwater metagenome TaxID=449393 RepID=A0A6J7C7E8_9ZZZZ|nr:hypothetical protein [Actinomycetota bacterium]MSW37216.1 hypothetical protein [Actinomycetota bacterium]MSX39101.1 hypothetical protein [Actinomycetota bacterium]
MATRIILARHGESTVNVIMLATDDHENNPLTDLGSSQAADLAARVHGEPISKIYTSPTQRARETGSIVAAELGLPIAIEWGLEEVRVGRHAGEVGEPWMLRVKSDFRRWFADEDLSHGYDGGETGYEAARRTAAALHLIAERHEGETVLVVSHGGAIALTVSTLCANVRLRDLDTRHVANCATVEVTFDSGTWTCLAWMGTAPEDFSDDDATTDVLHRDFDDDGDGSVSQGLDAGLRT